MKLHNRTVLITGGSRGIGLEMARLLLARGNSVIVTGRSQDSLHAAQRSLPGLQIIQSDVSDAAAISALCTEVTTRFPALDVLVNNAGIMRNLDFNQERDLDDVTREIDINLSGPVRMIQQFLPHLKTRASAIVNVSSGLAFVPFPASPVYCATKAALHSLCLTLRIQLEHTSVQVIELAPPAVETALLRAEFAREMQNQKGMEPTLLAARAIAGIEAGRLEIRPGLSNVLKLMSRIAPQFMLNQLAKASNR